MISNITWNLGGHKTYNASASTFYTAERGNPTTWTGYVGLMYPSDYGYAVGGSNRSSCLTTNLSIYNTSCASSNWLYLRSNEWTLSPISGDSKNAFSIYGNSGSLESGFGGYFAVRPVVYLNSNIKRTGGTGTSSDPFIIG